jgi:hypothetical protein
MSITALDNAFEVQATQFQLVIVGAGENNNLTSSRGANPVPYRLIPRTSPKAFLNTVPNAIALSCM